MRLLVEIKAGPGLLPLQESVAHLRVIVSSTSQQLRENTLLSAHSLSGEPSELCADQELGDT